MKWILLILGVLLWSSNAWAQLDWKEHREMAEAFMVQKQYFQAGAHYRLAWKKKSGKEELLLKAAQAYYTARAYKEAAEAYSHLRQQSWEEDPLLDIKYARCLKRDGQYELASRAFEDFLRALPAGSQSQYQEMIEREILGCRLGQQMQQDRSLYQISLSLDPKLNTPQDDSSPQLLSPNSMLLTTGDFSDRRLVRSDQFDGVWAAGGESAFPTSITQQAGSIALSPDGQTLYFTRCDRYGEAYGFLNEGCQIYYSENRQGAWTEPQILPSTLSPEDINNAYPHVFHKQGREYLVFSSDREGGFGSLDLWYTTRPLSGSIQDFDLPRNLGGVINTQGSELTPFYDPETQWLYFSSNGHVNIGGLDVFAAQGDFTYWESPTNMGMPYNSPCHDLYYVQNTTGRGGVLVSNRKYGFERTQTLDFDIFEFQTPLNPYMIYGYTIHAVEEVILPNTLGYLFEIDERTGEQMLVESKAFPYGKYAFALEPDKRYLLEFEKSGFYGNARVEFFTSPWPHPNGFRFDFYLDNTSRGDEPVIALSDYLRDNQPLRARGATNAGFPSENMEHSPGPAYRVQIGAFRYFNPEDPQFDPIKEQASLEWQAIPADESDFPYVRVYAGRTESLPRAQALCESIQSLKGFTDAFVVVFENGVRKEIIR